MAVYVYEFAAGMRVTGLRQRQNSQKARKAFEKGPGTLGP
jgi:hypothetical protein